ncbi:NUDIX domain-containing protein [Deinococcus metallilatus]|uniref:ADP-ribose pyrophosphatase YjhB (NUDIX family) n=1 Tax=Deinococcus metallilatus TaxID=1211322 RepID=A0AAJ5K0F3_9DEIO|nr:NUDIX domain-containing protein [Deinococcus metallilatus]MBB5294906.1 ADP-ribose pyrophosphatase YjhB (NUDIX family) [Deinococcus metallilatus]QBY09382.1 NUDIX domain-containing protein [Deinococcus metallilatus]RXJ09388.1 NUDIX domain-containing protein [Deinococcus metallilatus]TLK28910.1 NUDIX domain-containing protein [Deinococcus metallilatus]
MTPVRVSVLQTLKRRGQRAGKVCQQVGAGIAVLSGQGEVLLIRRGDNGLWDLPGGGVNVGEEVEAAARRELHEETGLIAGPLTLLGVFSGEAHRHTYPDGNVVAWVTVLYVARQGEGQHPEDRPRAGDDAAQVAWWPLAALPGEVGEATRAYFRVLRAQVGEGA